jgi:hypothetical protein
VGPEGPTAEHRGSTATSGIEVRSRTDGRGLSEDFDYPVNLENGDLGPGGFGSSSADGRPASDAFAII